MTSRAVGHEMKSIILIIGKRWTGLNLDEDNSLWLYAFDALLNIEFNCETTKHTQALKHYFEPCN